MTPSSALLASLLLLLGCAALATGCSGASTDGGGSSNAACSALAGEYAYDETFSGSCPSTASLTKAVTVKVTNGTDVVITDGSTLRVGCVLSGCTCTSKSGQAYAFEAGGFSSTEVHNGCTIQVTGAKH